MKKAIFIIALCSTFGWASGPKYNFKDPRLNDELENVYHDIANISNGRIVLDGKTKVQLTTLNTRAGWVQFCSDCSTDAVCVATGTINSFVRFSARTTACN